MAKYDVAVIGLGYVGLPTAAIIANAGLKVLGVDVSSQRLESIASGYPDPSEPGLDSIVSDGLESGNLIVSSELYASHTYIVAVPTPVSEAKGYDNSFVLSAGKKLAGHLEGGELIVLESTVPPGATEELANYIYSLRPELIADQSKALCFAHCPERVLPGNVLTEIIENDRIIGGLTPEATGRAHELYSLFCKGKLQTTDARTAELTKLSENAFRDVNIAFANELSIVSANLDVDIHEVIKLANLHPRVNILNPGVGVGGHCVPVDPWFIIDADRNGTKLLQSAREVNDSKARWCAERLASVISGQELEKIAIQGLSFKPNVGDYRNSPALVVTSLLMEEFPNSSFTVFEPHIDSLPEELASNINVKLGDKDDCIDKFDVGIRLVQHDDFKTTFALKNCETLLDYAGHSLK